MLIDIVGVVVIVRARVIGARAVARGSLQCVLALLNEFITPVSSIWKRNLERGGCSSPHSPPPRTAPGRHVTDMRGVQCVNSTGHVTDMRGVQCVNSTGHVTDTGVYSVS